MENVSQTISDELCEACLQTQGKTVDPPRVSQVLTDQGMQQIVMQQSDALRVPGQQIQLQLVTADGESAGQILLQMSDDGTAQPQIEVQQQQPTMLQLDPSQLQQQQQLIQQQVRR